MNIFVAKLNFETTGDDLRDVFEQFGTVDSAKVIIDHYTGKSRGFGFVEMPDEDEGQNAIDQLNDTDLDGNTIVVKKAEPRKPRGGGFDRGGRGGGGGGYGGNRGGGGGYGGNRGGGGGYGGNRGGGGYGGNRGGGYDRGGGGGYRDRNDRNDWNDRDNRNDDYNKW